jgi:hypothetical protein
MVRIEFDIQAIRLVEYIIWLASHDRAAKTKSTQAMTNAPAEASTAHPSPNTTHHKQLPPHTFKPQPQTHTHTHTHAHIVAQCKTLGTHTRFITHAQHAPLNEHHPNLYTLHTTYTPVQQTNTIAHKQSHGHTANPQRSLAPRRALATQYPTHNHTLGQSTTTRT